MALEDVAAANLQKIEERWGSDSTGSGKQLDEGYPEHERFPRQFSIQFSLQEIEGRQVAVMTYNGQTLGNPLTDNSYIDDDYRFHDAFHIAHTATLGWSPVLRALMKLKRKSDKRTDEVDDGGRAIAIEEGVTVLIFDYLVDNQFLATTERVDYELLKQVIGVTERLEVKERSVHDWEHAIRAGAQLWKSLSANGGGWVDADLDRRTVQFRSSA